MRRMLLLLSMFWINQCCAQKIVPKDLFGEWQVKNYILFLNVGSETTEEYTERSLRHDRCLQSKFIIEEASISATSGFCAFNSCSAVNWDTVQLKIKRVVEDDFYTREARGDEMVDSNIVGKGFVRLIDSAYDGKTILILDTPCFCDWGSFTAKVCIVSINRIAIFCGADLFVLERRKKI